MVHTRYSRKLLIVLLCFFALPARSFEPVAAKHGMVVSAEPLASEAGLQILKAGGFDQVVQLFEACGTGNRSSDAGARDEPGQRNFDRS